MTKGMAEKGQLAGSGGLMLKRNDDEATRIADKLARRSGTGIFTRAHASKTVVQQPPGLNWVEAKK